MLAEGARLAFGLLSVAVFASAGIFAALWLTIPGRWDHPVLYLLASAVVLYLFGVWAAPWLAFVRMQRPIALPAQPDLRVAVVTTFVPGTEPIEMLALTLRALLVMRYPHDTWVLDEGDDPAVRELCHKLGAIHFSRRDRAEYQTPEGRYAAGSKYGNYNAWLAEVGFERYDVLASFDTDHVPEPHYLERTLGYLRDPQVGYVQTPQVYYNQGASFIARGAAEESYLYYSSLQMSSYALGEPTVTGSHTVHRMESLRAVDGFPPHDAEDLYLTLLYRMGRWRGIYVPEILALGTTPVDWRSYLRQQARWARALIDLKLHVYPGLAHRLAPMDRLLGLLHGAYYLRPLVMVAVYPMLLYVLVTNERPAFLGVRAMSMLVGLSLVLALADRFRQHYFLDPARERGLHWRSLLLQFAKWPYFARSLWQGVRGWRGAYVMTPKVGLRTPRGGRRGDVAVPQLALSAGLCIAAIAGMLRHGTLPPTAAIVSGVLVSISLGLACSDALRFPPPFEPWRHERRRAELAGGPASPLAADR